MPSVPPPTHTWDGVPVDSEAPYGSAVVVWRPGEEGREYLVLHRTAPEDPGGDWAWTPPSGARQPGEEPAAAARRELFEETGLDLELRATRCGDEGWLVWVAEAPLDVEVVLDAEHDSYAWLAAEDAATRCLPPAVGESIRCVDRVEA